MRISVVVPTRDRPRSLARCLQALRMQRGASVDVIVVDDGSADPGSVASLARSAGVESIRLRGRGPAAARNAGATVARGDVVLFTDDDCEPAPGWAAALAAGARESRVAAGATVSPPGARAPVVASQLITNHLMLSGRDASMRLAFAPTSNLGCSREALRRLPFDESYPTAAGEDREWCRRAAAAGMPPAFVPEAVVVHRQEPTVAGFLRQQLRYGRGAARFRLGPGAGTIKPEFYLELARRGLEQGPAVGGLVVGAQAAVAVGFALERIAARR